LHAAVRHAAAGAGGLAFVLGEAGIGKSRLVAEAERVAAEAGLRLLRGRAVENQAFVVGVGQVGLTPPPARVLAITSRRTARTASPRRTRSAGPPR
jgi:predicted amidohydrolase